MRTVPALVPVVIAGVLAAAAAASPIDTAFPTFGGAGNAGSSAFLDASAVSGDTLFLGGCARWAGPLTGGGVPVRASDLSPLAGFPRVNGSVLAATADGAGGWYIGGRFTHVGGLPRANLAHVLADLSVDAWAPGTNGDVVAIAATAADVWFAGHFTTVGDLPSAGFAAVTKATATLVLNPPMGGAVSALATDGSSVFLGGDFTSVDGAPRSRLAAYRASDHALAGWTADADAAVLALRVASGRVYAGGDFTAIHGQPRGGGAALDPVTGEPFGWDPHMGSYSGSGVRALLVVGDRIYLGGGFTQMGGVARSCLAAVDTESGALLPWNPQVGASVPSKLSPPVVTALELDGADVVAGGLFDEAGAAPRNDLVRLGAISGVVLPGAPEVAGEVDALARSGTGLLVGGQFATLGASRRGDLVAVRLSTGELLPWAPDVTRDHAETFFGDSFWHTSHVTALAVDAEHVYVGLAFYATNPGSDFGAVLAVSRATGAKLWDVPFNRSVNALAVNDTVLYVGGEFFTPSRAVIAVSTATGTEIGGWGVANDARAYALALTPTGLVVGGVFTSLGGQARTDLAMLDPATGLATAWDPEPNDAVWSLAAAGNTLFCGGDFTTIAGQPRSHLASVALDSAAADDWDPGANATVRGLTFDQGVLFVAGSFTSLGGQARSSFAAVNASSGAVLPFDPGIGPGRTVYAVAHAAGRTVIAGSQATSGVEPTLALTALAGPDPTLAANGPRARRDRGTLHVEPQPARTVAEVRLRLPRETDAEIGLYDLTGRKLAILDPWNHRPAGEVTISLEARKLPPGIYIVRAITPEGDVAGKLVVLP